jgi:sulfur carrier protein
MNVILNGEPAQVPADATVRTALDALDVPADARGVAVAVDAAVVPRGEWATHHLDEGARVEIVRAIQGG